MKVDVQRKRGRPTLWLAGIAAAALIFILAGRETGKSGVTLTTMLKQSAAREWKEALYDCFLPMASMTGESADTPYLLRQQVTEIMPFYGYVQRQEGLLVTVEESGRGGLTGTEAFAEDNEPKNQDRGSEAFRPSVAVPEENQEDLAQMLRAENEAALSALMEQENNPTVRDAVFVPHTLQNPLALEELADYETLVSRFYTIDANTMAGREQLDAELLGGIDLTIDKGSDGPQILIYHTHSQEGFADSVEGDDSTTIMGVGDRLTDILTNQYGYQVLHHTGKYDVESRDDAYSPALPALQQVLAENPTIEVVIDLHRDQMPKENRLVMDLDGRPTAQFMFFNGLSRTKKTGNIAYLYNEYQEENLAFSFQMKLAAEQYYPGLTRKIYLKGYRYNMHLKPRSLLIELGAQNNTLEEAMNACDPIAHLLDLVLSGGA